MAISSGGTLTRRTALAVLAGVVVSVTGPLQAKPPAADGAGFASAASTDARVAAFGSSTIARSAPRFAAEFQGMSFYNGGQGGEVAEETLARLGSRPVRVDEVTIPASGQVIVRDGTLAGIVRSMEPFTGTLAGVRGALSTSGLRQGTFTFTRADPGPPVPVREGAPFLPDHGQRGSILILNLGKNNLNGSGGTKSVSTLLQWTRDAVAWNGGATVLVIGHFVNTDSPRTGSALRQAVTAYNSAARAEFGRQFFDLDAFLTSSDVWQYAGIIPTGADRRQQAAGNKPPSLSADSSHLNTAGETAVVGRIHEHLSGLGWLRSGPVGPAGP